MKRHGWTLILMLLVTMAFGAALLPAAESEKGAKTKREVGLLGARPGTGSYGFSQALTALVDRHSQWLTIHLRTASGATEHLRIMTEEPKERAANLFTSELLTFLWAREGIEYFKQSYKGARAIALFSNATLVLSTYDANIKGKDGFVGKRIMAYPKFFSSGRFVDVIFNDVWKIGDKVTLSHGFPAAGIRALGDGTVDAAQVDVDGMPGGPWKPGEELSQLQVLKPGLYFVGFSDADFEAASKVLKIPLPAEVISPGSYGANQTEPIRGIDAALFWAADEEMDVDVVYEVTKIIYEHIDELNASYPSSLMTRKQMAALRLPKDLFHPGALKFYEEVGVPVGVK